MALTITIEGKGVIANADSTTTDSAGGSWARTGSGGVAWGTTTDTYYYGTTSISMALSGAGKNSWIYHDIGAGNELDFTSGGTEEGQHIYVWIHCPTLGLSETLANEGVAFRVGSGTGAYRSFILAGNNATNGWDGRWKCFIIDPTKAGSIADTGSPNFASIRYMGLRGATTATAKGDNFFISQIAVGFGLRITGTSTTGWAEAVSYCTDLPNRAWGMLQEREGIFYQNGNIIIGDATSQSANVSFTDSGRVIQAGSSEYWSGTGTTFVTSADVNYMGLTVEDHGSWTTTVTDGVIVGSDNGRSGSLIIGNANHNYFLDLYGGNNAGSVSAFYGTTFKNLTGALVAGNDGDHAFLGCSFVGCQQFDPVGAPVIRNTTFAETVSTTGALLWNSNIDIQNSAFIANTTGEAIEHDAIISVATGTAGAGGNEQATLDDLSGWVTTGTTVVVDQATDPYGDAADEIREDTSTGGHRVLYQVDVVSGTRYVFGCVAKANGRSELRVDLNDTPFGTNSHADFNLSGGTITATGAGVESAHITSLGSGWYLCQVVDTAGSTETNSNIWFRMSNGAGYTYAGDGSSGVMVSKASFTESSATVLKDAGATFTSTVAVNDYAYNETDGSYAKVTVVVSDTELTLEALADDPLVGGTGGLVWDYGDAYSISPAVTYTNLTFSGNTSDVTNSATGSDALFVSKSGTSNPATATGTIVYLGSVPITVTVKDEAGAAIQNAQTGVFLVSDGSALINADTNASGQVTASYTGTTGVDVKVWIRKASSGATKYKNYSSVQTIGAAGLALSVTLLVDPNNNATT